MIEPPQIIQTAPQHAASIHLVVPRDEIRAVMGPAISELFQTVAAQGIAPAGPWFTHHLRRPTDTFDFEACVPVTTPIAPAGRVQPGEWPAMRVVRTVYHGGYEGLGEAWGELLDWIAKEGLKTTEELWEGYVVGPESGPDAAAYRTQLSRPLVE